MFKKQQGQQIVELKSKSGQLRKFTKVKYLGSGGFARCYEVFQQIQGVKTHYAVKIIKKSTLYQSKQLIERLRTEIRLHKKFSQPQHKQNTHIAQFIDSFETQDYIYFLLQLCVNQTLNQLIRRRKILSQEQTRFFIKQLAEGLKQIHEKNVVHRDIKLCNLFLSNGLVLKIGDFGLATQIKENKKRFTLCGTANYIAPQMIQKNSDGSTIGHGYEVDVWALGVVCYTIYYGRYPFEAQEQQSIYNKITACKYSFNPYTIREMKDLNINGLNHFPSSQLQSFIKSIFQIDPAKRLTLDEVLQHPFLNKTTVPKQLPQIALKCQLKRETIESLFVPKNNHENCIPQQKKQKSNVQKNEIQQNGAQIKQKATTMQNDSQKPSKNNIVRQDLFDDCQKNNDKLKGRDLKNKSKLFFQFQKKIGQNCNKKEENIVRKQILLQVIINKSKNIFKKQNQKHELGKNGMMIKVFSKNKTIKNKQKQKNGLQRHQNQYSLILHPKLTYFTKVYNQKVPQRKALKEVQKPPQNLFVTMNSQKQQRIPEIAQKLKSKKVEKIPFISMTTNTNIQLKNQVDQKYKEEFYIIKMVFQSLQNLYQSNQKETTSLLNLQRNNSEESQLQKHKITSLYDIATTNSQLKTSLRCDLALQSPTVQSLKCV